MTVLKSPAPAGLFFCPSGNPTPALEGRVFISLGFQPQAGVGCSFRVAAATIPPHLGLKPQAGEYPPLQGGRTGVPSRPPTVLPRSLSPPSPEGNHLARLLPYISVTPRGNYTSRKTNTPRNTKPTRLLM